MTNNKKTSLVSVIVTSYNQEKYIKEAIDSVFACDYPNTEVIVVDDGSTDGTLEILKSYPPKIKIISQENKGQSVARNVGIREAKGDFIGLLDGDDLWTKEHIALGLEFLKNDEYDFVRGNTVRFKVLPDGTKKMADVEFVDMLIGASFYSSKLFDKVGLFDEELREGEDVDWFIRIAENNCREKRVYNIMLLWRRHENNLTNSPKFITQGLLNAYKKRIQRSKNK